MKNYIVFDLEMSIIHKNPKQHETISEVIQIGAVKLDEDFREISSFVSYVRPTIFRKLRSWTKKITNIQQKDVDKAPKFCSIIQEFIKWADYQKGSTIFVSWGTKDALVLHEECKRHKINHPIKLLYSKYLDLQLVCSLPRGKTHLGLKEASELVGLPLGYKAHDALEDARQTAALMCTLFEIRPKIDEMTNAGFNFEMAGNHETSLPHHETWIFINSLSDNVFNTEEIKEEMRSKFQLMSKDTSGLQGSANLNSDFSPEEREAWYKERQYMDCLANDYDEEDDEDDDFGGLPMCMILGVYSHPGCWQYNGMNRDSCNCGFDHGN